MEKGREEELDWNLGKVLAMESEGGMDGEDVWKGGREDELIVILCQAKKTMIVMIVLVQ